MIYFDKTEVVGWEHAIRGMRNPLNSWDKSDSSNIAHCEDLWCDECPHQRSLYCATSGDSAGRMPLLGPNDLKLMKSLAKAGPSHAKYRRFIDVYVDIIAPLYWWKEFETYRLCVASNPMDIEINSCSTMHKIHSKEFTLDDFSHEHLETLVVGGDQTGDVDMCNWHNFRDSLEETINDLNLARKLYLETNDKRYWWQMIQLLPASYNQKRTLKMNYQVLAEMYECRKNHKLDEWADGVCEWIESLPYSELITGGKDVES